MNQATIKFKKVRPRYDISDEKHHEDYSRPLDVVWLCRRCHMAEHSKVSALSFTGNIGDA